jgi:c-di-GMP-binding flagellar brake protein YcgR
MSIDAGAVQLEKGMECLLNVTGRHFLVHVLELNGDLVHLSFPGRDYPVEGISANIECHDEDGFYYCQTEVVQGPRDDIVGIMVRKLSDFRRSTHRQSFRAPTDLTVQVKEQIHARRYNAALINISAGGALIQSEAPFEFNSLIELNLGLPSEPQHNILCQIVHMIEGVGRNNVPVRYFGLKFINVEGDVANAITRYACQQLRKLYTASKFIQPA